jgi:glycosyltransferase involved in cell wall biosynthesis
VAIPGICNADQVVTISDYVSGKVQDHLHIPRARLQRIYNGVKPLPPAAASGPRPPYILCVGSLQPHKNLARLIHAYGKLRAEFPGHELWIVGRPQPHFQNQPELTQLLQQPGVRVLGYLSEADLGEAYRQARLFCYPSLEEGFGLPMLEAMIAGTLVVASNVSCLPEIAGPAAELVDPYSVDSLADGMRALLKLEGGPRQQRVEAGRKWALGFTWQAAARQYVELYRRILSCN